MKENIKKIRGYNDYKEFNESGCITLYSNLSFAQRNQGKGEKIEYIYDENNRLIKEIIEYRNYYDHTYPYEIFEKKYEYNEFGYRITKFKTKLIHNFFSDPNSTTTLDSYDIDHYKRYPVDVNELISIIDIKLKNNKIVYKKSSNLLNNKIIQNEFKYDNNKLIEEKSTDFQKNTISKTINEFENDLIKTTKKYFSNIGENEILNEKTSYQYLNGLVVSIKNYVIKNNNLELNFETRYKYDDQNRIIEEVKANFEKEEYIYATDYYYLTEWNYHIQDDCEKIISVKFDHYNPEKKQMLVDSISIKTLNSESQCINRASMVTEYGNGYDFFKCLNSEHKYLTTKGIELNELELDDIKRIRIDSMISASVETIDYAYLSIQSKENCIMKKTMISLSEYNVEIVGNETYEYYSKSNKDN
ncbi:hypothetical protein [Algibacter pacificus]|uniref:hypothetical protein n=1 Tax=Algibacter pacificus TaxID=2599389 RepID=UPI0011C9D0EA|nr:hypothetical protein [Algibacter pacificus]